jgi:hypothetical protein
MKFLFASVFSAFVITSNLNGATVTFDNFFVSGVDVTGAYGVRDASGALASNSFHGIMGKFTIADSAVTSNFASGNVGAIASGFQAFDSVTGSFDLGNPVDGVFQSTESFDTKASSNSLGGSSVYAVFYNTSAIATATQLFIAKLTAVFPTDPELGATLIGKRLTISFISF